MYFSSFRLFTNRICKCGTSFGYNLDKTYRLLSVSQLHNPPERLINVFSWNRYKLYSSIASLPLSCNNRNLYNCKWQIGQWRYLCTNNDDAEKLEKEKQRERQQRYTKYTLIVMTALFGGFAVFAVTEWGSPQRDSDGNIIEDEFSKLPVLQQYTCRTWNAIIDYNAVLREPSRDLLLPPPLQPPYYQPPYTLVLEMTGVLVHPEWTYKTGWRFKKRPFVDHFLQQCATSSLYEIVVYTHEQGFTAYALLDSLDPNGFIMYRLFRDSTRYENGVHIKDLNCLNRDLSKVIHIDWNKGACKLNPDNCLTLKKWDGDSNDRTLYDLTNFLKAVAAEGVDDVRDVIRHYKSCDDPLEAFKENQRKLAEHEKDNEKIKEQIKTRPLLSSLRLR